MRGAAGDEIVRVSLAGTVIRSLIKVPGAALSSPMYSPDGSKIALLQCVGGCGDPDLHGTGSVWVMDADGSDPTLILDQTAGVQPVGYLDWVGRDALALGRTPITAACCSGSTPLGQAVAR